jgi:hydroxymethylbilane synthase
MPTLRLGTRRSPLAMAQSQLIAGLLADADATLAVELVGIDTAGDRQAGPLAAAGGKGLFTAELESQLAEGAIDLAVHSLKDMPALGEAQFVIGALPVRGDARDALVSRLGLVDDLPPGAKVGTGSPRRAAQLRALRSDLQIEPIRGNIQTRLARAVGPEADLDAVVLAVAGLNRAGLRQTYRHEIHPLPVEQCIPAAGQGALAVQCRSDNEPLLERLAGLHDVATAVAVRAERDVVRFLEADCHSCLAVHFHREFGQWVGQCFAARPDGSGAVRLREAHESIEPVATGLLAELDRLGGAALLG